MNDDFAYRVYHDEPIIIAAAHMESRIPPKYRDMRKIANTMGAYGEPYEKIFYKQGKFMEDFEDDFDYREDFQQYFPTYQSMGDRQLRGFFSWRANVRRGTVEKAPLSFAFLYIYELINQIGVSYPEEGFYALKNFWAAYRGIDFRIDRYVKLWLKDYVVYNNLDKSLLEDIVDTNIYNSLLTLLSYKSRDADEVFSALNSMSSYKLNNSRFFKQYPDDVKTITYDVFSALSEHYDKNCKETLCEKLVGKLYTSSYNMFNSAVFYDRIRHADLIYKINDFCKYMCKNGNWRCESLFYYMDRKRQIAALLKAIDFTMRQKYNFRSALKPVKTTKTVQGIIYKAIEQYRENQREAARQKIEIDVSRLEGIRNAALETQNKLLAGEVEEADAAPEFFNKKPPVPENETGLGNTEYLFMKRLLHGEAYSGTVQSNGVPLSVLIDAINEKLFDRFGDTVIIEAGDRPELVADYVEKLKEIIKS